MSRRSLGVRLALAVLAAALAAAAALALLRRRRTPLREPETPEVVASWPPVPVLGRPTEADLARYDKPPPKPPRLPDLPLPSLPEEPVARRRVQRWAAVVVVLGLLFCAQQWLENSVFPHYDESTTENYEVTWEPSFSCQAPAEPGWEEVFAAACGSD
ncbi:hypothetical protein ACIBG8_18015 [Nonomuraea sp. NPDC050556]|uniref:hypothetical protein n=1 Tax=Nonomuraea sp. NPDC050556 TaxID=3364369 RepID=UPI0037925743